MKKIATRLKALISEGTSESKRFKELEDLTGITSGTWRSWWNREGTPGGDTIEAICKVWPEHAFWLVTGISDPEHGHRAPGDTKKGRHPRTAAKDLFLAEIEFAEWLKDNEFTLRDLEDYLDEEGPPNTVEFTKKAKAYIRFEQQLTRLDEIRRDQEISLRKHDKDAFFKDFFPDDDSSKN